MAGHAAPRKCVRHWGDFPERRLFCIRRSGPVGGGCALMPLGPARPRLHRAAAASCRPLCCRLDRAGTCRERHAHGHAVVSVPVWSSADHWEQTGAAQGGGVPAAWKRTGTAHPLQCGCFPEAGGRAPSYLLGGSRSDAAGQPAASGCSATESCHRS